MEIKMQVKASYTVEAALICPFLCFILCGIILLTLSLYRQVECFSIEQQKSVERTAEAVNWIRVESIVKQFDRRESK